MKPVDAYETTVITPVNNVSVACQSASYHNNVRMDNFEHCFKNGPHDHTKLPFSTDRRGDVDRRERITVGIPLNLKALSFCGVGHKQNLSTNPAFARGGYITSTPKVKMKLSKAGSETDENLDFDQYRVLH